MTEDESVNKATSKPNEKSSIPIRKLTTKELSVKKKSETISKTDVPTQKPSDIEIVGNTDAFAKDKHVYDKIYTEYLITVAEAFSMLSEVNPIPYIFEVNDMYKNVEALTEEKVKKNSEKLIKKNISKPALKEIPKKTSRDVMFLEKEDPLVETVEQMKQEK